MHVVAQEQVGGLQALHVDLLNAVVLARHAQPAQGPQHGGEEQPLAQRGSGGVVAPQSAVVDVNGFHGLSPFP